MDWFSKAFLKASLCWLTLGATAGGALAAHPPWVVYRPAHAHMMVLGFVSMMIFGVAYHVIPRFTGHPLHSPRLARAHWWVANSGLSLLVAGFVVRPHALRAGAPLLAFGGLLAMSGAYLFAYNLWRTLDGRWPARIRGDVPRNRRMASLPLIPVDE
jgi:cbb3-type cytochrome oxidase subunit 1